MKKTDRSRRRKAKGSSLRWLAISFFVVACSLLVAAGVTLSAFYVKLNHSLPSAESLRDYHPPLVTSVYAADGSLIAEFFNERRYLVPLSDLPHHLVYAFLAAEDARFYEHGGVDLVGVIRAVFKNLQAGEIVQGGSTISQQVVKSLLLTPERSFMRKIKEAILAYRIDHFLSKDQILYLYLNQIYFGAGAYGVEAAARTYFDKHASQLTLNEAALLAGLPKAPSKFSPFQNFAASRERQQYVLMRMAESGFIPAAEAQKALDQPLRLSKPRHWTLKELNHFTEEVRRELEARYGRDVLYKEGLNVYTTLDPKAQQIAEKVLDQGLRELDKRHSRYRGIHVNVPKDDWPNALKVLARTNGEISQGKVVAALVTSYDPKGKTCELSLGDQQAVLPASGWGWAQVSANRASRMFRIGDVIRVRLESPRDKNTWTTVLEQDPGMEGAFLAVTPQTGAVLCMVGGRNFQKSQYNRATQAVRQPGSAFKPIIYAAALDKGFTEASILIDSPIVMDDHSLKGPWKPANYDRKFWGPITLYKALVHSRNVVTVKLLESIGVKYASGYAKRMGITSQLTPTLALALGASGVTPMELTTAYTAFANQGDRVDPYLIEKVQDRNGRVLEQHEVQKENVLSPQTAYVMTNLLQGVVEEGTGTKAKQLGRPAAGKTGTTNEMRDAWFVGFTPGLLATAWVGYDDHNISLGKGETGGHAACPIWLYFMQEYLKGRPIEAFPIPSGVIMAKMNPNTGAIVRPEDQSAVYAAFSGNLPTPKTVASEESPGEERDSVTESGTYAPSDSENFFKSDLF